MKIVHQRCRLLQLRQSRRRHQTAASFAQEPGELKEVQLVSGDARHSVDVSHGILR